MELEGKDEAKVLYRCIFELNKNILFSQLDSIDGPKTIVWDKVLIKRFDLFATSELLKQHKVVSMLHFDTLQTVSLAQQHRNFVYILSSSLKIINKLTAFLDQARSDKNRHAHHVLFVPDASFVLQDRLKENKQAYSMLQSLNSLPLRIFPLYDDQFTLFLDDILCKLLLNDDWTYLQKCAMALHQIEVSFQCRPNIRCKGKWSAQIVEMIKKMRTNEDVPSEYHEKCEISEFVIIDRWMDPLTPLLFQLTYGGLIDDIMKIGPSGNIRTNLMSENANVAEPAEVSLKDDLYFSLRDQHVKDVGKSLLDIISQIREERKDLKNFRNVESLAENKTIVRRLVDMQKSEKYVDTHTTIAGYLMNFIRDDSRYSKLPQLQLDVLQGCHGDRIIPFVEDLLIEAYEPTIILRLIALQSLVNGGLKQATFSTYQRLFVQSFGTYKLSLWLKLQLMGLITEKGSKVKCNYLPFDFNSVKRKLAYSSDDHSLDQASQIYGDHAPFLARYVEIGLKNCWKDWTTIASGKTAPSSNSLTVLIVVGGLTMSEMAYLRQLKLPCKLVTITTSLISGDRIIQALSA